MTGKNIIFNDRKINKSRFYKNKKLFNIDDIDVNKILVSKRESYGTKKSFKYFIRGAATNNGPGGRGGEGRFKSGPFLYQKYKRGIKESNVSSLC